MAEDLGGLILELKYKGALKSAGLERVLRAADRKNFVPAAQSRYAYVDEPLPIAGGQTISQPSTVVMMTEALDVMKGNKVLEIGAGSGWQAAIIAKLVGKEGFLWTIERLKELADFASSNLLRAGIKNVKVLLGDGSQGYEKGAPYDRIIVTAACPDIPQPLIEQLKEGGIIVIPVGDFYTQDVIVGTKIKGAMIRKSIGTFRFVPLVGRFGFEK